MTNFVARVANVSQLPLLYKATGNDESPVTGPMLTDMTKLAFESFSSSNFLQDFLLDKLNSPGCFTRAKALRITKYLIDHGPLQFTVSLRRKADPIEKCRVFTGPSDLLHGDALYVAVRQHASEVLDALYDDNRDAERRMNSNPSAGGGYSGMGGGGGGGGSGGVGGGGMMGIAGPSQSSSSSTSSAAPPGTTHYNADGSKKMWGFGNTPVQQEDTSLLGALKSKANDVVDSLQQYAAKGAGGTTTHPLSSNAHGSLHASGSGAYVAASAATYATGRYDANDLEEETANRAAGRPGGGWDATSSSTSSAVSRASSTSTSTGTRELSTPSPVSSTPSPPGVVTSRPEDRLVGEFTAVAGVRAAPSREQVQQFLQRCKRMDIGIVIGLLVDALSMSQQSQLRALRLLEELLQSDVNGASQRMADIAGSALQQLAQTSQGAVQSKASKLLRQLQPVQPVAVSTSHQQVTSSPQAVVAPSPSSASSSGFADILDLSSPPPNVDHTALSTTSAASTAAAPAPAQASGELFAGMAMGGVLSPNTSQPSPAAAAAAPPARTVQPATQSHVPVSQTVTEPTSMMAGITLSSQPVAGAPSTAAGPAITGGADLMSGQELDPFDPFKGLGSSSQSQPSQSTLPSSSSDLMFGSGALAAQPQAAPGQYQFIPQPSQPMVASTQAMMPGARPMMSSSQPMMSSPQPMMSGAQPGMMASGGQAMPAMNWQMQPAAGVGGSMVMSSSNMAAAGYAPQNRAGMYAGPVGRTEVQIAKTGQASDGFSFLGQNKKAGAFDFVQDAMKAEKK